MTAPDAPRILSERYRLEGVLGQGGMATVFVATDLRHGRSVALKMLREPFSGSLGTERFLREISVTAQLDHPHLVPLLDSGTDDGDLFYVMPLVEGETLRDRLAREKQLSVEAALAIAHDVLDALAYAHARGVIHRDIKPENILLAGGHARVADFGVARAVAAASGDTLTGTGIALGTPTYMSPEQGSADRDLDARSDVYAVGCVLYEMLAGQPPFVGPTVESVVRQHLAAEPRPVSQLRPTVPEGVVLAVNRALAKAPADRFANATAFAAALSAADTSTAPSTSSPRRRAITGLAALAVVAVSAIGIALWRGRPAPPPERPVVAVLPFRNLGAADDDYIADGVTEEIALRLASISGIRVTSRQTAMQFRGTSLTVPEIARQLGVQYVLAGTIRTERMADGTKQVRVTPNLVRAVDDTQLWTNAYTSTLVLGDFFALQARIAERVAEAFNVSLLRPEVAAVRRSETQDTAAYAAVQLGRYQMAKGPSLEAIGHFERAITLDPRYARAHASLAAAYISLLASPNARVPQAEAFKRAETAARRALELDPESAAAHSALGYVLAQGYWRWTEAEQAQRRAIAIDPEDAEAHERLSEVLGVLGKQDEAIREAVQAQALEPTSAQMRLVLSGELSAAGRAAEAAGQIEEVLRLEPSNPFARVQLAELAAARGDLRGMAGELKQLAGLTEVAAALAAWAEARGPTTEVVRAIDAIRSPNPELDHVRRGWLFAAIGESARALEEFERAVLARTPAAVSALRFRSVRRALADEPRFKALLAKTGIRDAMPR